MDGQNGLTEKKESTILALTYPEPEQQGAQIQMNTEKHKKEESRADLPLCAGVMKKSYEIDMCHGPLLGKILLFVLPLVLSNILQLLFNAADIVVVGRYVGSQALAAVGSTSSLIQLITNVFVGLSVGVNVLAARYYGSRADRDLSETVHTAIVMSLISGVFLIFAGIGLARPLLQLMGSPEDVLGQSVLYLRIYFAGMPAFMLYNFGSAILRAAGDTRRPLYYLFAAGVLNVVLNLWFVISFGLGVAGVALATVISQCVSAGLVLLSLVKSPGAMKVSRAKLRISRHKAGQIIGIGLPAGVQSAIFSVSNVLIQSAVNSFGSVAMAGSTSSSNIEGFVYTAMNAVYQACLSFTSQNVGGKKYSRINRILGTCLGVTMTVGLVLGLGAVALGPVLLRIYSSDPEVIAYGMRRLLVVCSLYCLCGLMDTMVGSLRGMGYSIIPMIASLTGSCGLRVLWVYTVFAVDRSWDILFLSYPVSWIVTTICHVVYFIIVRKKLPREDGPEEYAGEMAAAAEKVR